MAYVNVHVCKKSFLLQSGPIKKMPTARSVFPKRRKKENLIVALFVAAGLLLTISQVRTRIRPQNDENATYVKT